MLTKIKNQKSKINFGKLEIKMSITCISKKIKDINHIYQKSKCQSHQSNVKMSISYNQKLKINLILI